MKLIFTVILLIFIQILPLRLQACVIDSVTITPATCLSDADASLVIHASGAPGLTYSIDGGSTFVPSNTFTNLSPGTYIIVVNSPLPCSVTDTVVIGASSVLLASLSANPQVLSIGDVVSFTNNSIGETTFTLFFGDGDSVANLGLVSHVYTTSGAQTAMLIASNAFCLDTAFITIDVIVNSSLTIPNVFTPNGDDVNDLWMPQALGIETMKAVIYNRYGEIVHTWLGAKGYWDGFTFPSGVACSEGTYFYWIEAVGFDGVVYGEKGIISLLR